MNSTVGSRLVRLALVAAGAGSTPALAQTPHFYDDDPIQVEPVTQNVTKAKDYEPNISWSYVTSFTGQKGTDEFTERAGNVNTVDEVPDGPFFVNRAGRIPLTPALVARAANTDDGPVAPWTIVSGKSDGVTPGFTLRDAHGRKWYLKFDPPGWSGMASGSEIIGSKLFWALGYHTSEYHIVRLRRADMVIAPGAKMTPPHGPQRLMRPTDLDQLLARADRAPDGSYRAVASAAIPGRYVGRILYQGTRRDDPNDLVPHEHHREMRAAVVFSAWLNRVDVKRDQSIETVVTEDGRSFIRHYLLDWTSILGSAGIGPRERWHGYEEYIEPPLTIAARTAGLGVLIPSWRTRPFYESPAIGRIPLDESGWDPERWRPMVPNAAFLHARAEDKFWAAYKMTFIAEDIIRAVVAEAQFSDSAAVERLTGMILARRARILATYLPSINPLVEPTLTSGGQLTFRNAAVEAGVAPAPRGYRAVWSVFDNDAGVTTPIATTDASTTTIDAPALPAGGFIKVEVSGVDPPRASWTVPVVLYFRWRGGAWYLVGLERGGAGGPAAG